MFDLPVHEVAFLAEILKVSADLVVEDVSSDLSDEILGLLDDDAKATLQRKLFVSLGEDPDDYDFQFDEDAGTWLRYFAELLDGDGDQPEPEEVRFLAALLDLSADRFASETCCELSPAVLSLIPAEARDGLEARRMLAEGEDPDEYVVRFSSNAGDWAGYYSKLLNREVES